MSCADQRLRGNVAELEAHVEDLAHQLHYRAASGHAFVGGPPVNDDAVDSICSSSDASSEAGRSRMVETDTDEEAAKADISEDEEWSSTDSDGPTSHEVSEAGSLAMECQEVGRGWEEQETAAECQAGEHYVKLLPAVIAVLSLFAN